MGIEGVELVVYLEDGNQFCMDLSAVQTAVVLKILGVKPLNEEHITCYSDDALNKLVNIEGNPFRFAESE